jgi:hypothetical protein
VASKADTLSGSLAGTGSIADRLYAQEKAAYVGPLLGALSMNDYLVGNGHSKNQIQ